MAAELLLRDAEGPALQGLEGVQRIQGLRGELFERYSPLSLRAWVRFLKDCNVLTLTTSRAVSIFEQVCLPKEPVPPPSSPHGHAEDDGLGEDGESDPQGSPGAAEPGTPPNGLVLDYDEFGLCIHAVASHVYDSDPNACVRFCALHLLPLAGAHCPNLAVMSHADPAIKRWRSNKEVHQGLVSFFNKHTQHGGFLRLQGWQRFLRSVGMFPHHLSLVSLQDAFFETLLQATFEDCQCNQAQKTQICKLGLNLPTFVEALCRVFVKSKLFRDGKSTPELLRLMDRFLFPRRYMRYCKNRKGSSGTGAGVSQGGSPRKTPSRQLRHGIGRATARKQLLQHQQKQERVEEDDSESDAGFRRFFQACTDPMKRKVARLQLFEFLSDLSGTSLCRQLDSSGNPTGALVGTPPSRRAVAALQELSSSCLHVKRAVQRNQEQENGSPMSLSSLSLSGDPEHATTPNKASRASGASTPRGFISLERHEVVLTKLQALEDALNIDGLDDLDWDGTLQDAEQKMKDLVPQMMSEDPTEQHAASEKFELLDKIVRNHKDYKAREQKKKEQWKEDNYQANLDALAELQKIFPPCIAEGTAIKDLSEVFNLAPALAKRVFQRKALRFIHMKAEDIAKLHVADLTGTYSTQGLDLRELRAIFAVLPDEFGSDGDGKKAAWKESVLGALQDMIRKSESGSLPKAQQVHPAYSAPDSKSLQPSALQPSSPGLVRPSGGGGAKSLMEELKAKRRNSTSVIGASSADTQEAVSPAAAAAAAATAAVKSGPPLAKKASSHKDFLQELLNKSSSLRGEAAESDSEDSTTNAEEEEEEEEETKAGQEKKRRPHPLRKASSISEMVSKYNSDVAPTEEKAKPSPQLRKMQHRIPAVAASPRGLMDELSAVLGMRRNSCPALSSENSSNR